MTTLKPIRMQNEFISEAKARIIANLKADGAIWKSGTNYVIKYEVGNKEQLNRFKKDLENIYGISTKIILHNSGFTGKPFEAVYLRSKLVFEDLQNFGKYRSKNWDIPNEIMNSSMKIKAAFLRAFFDDEGSPIVSSKEVRLYSINSNGLKEIANILNEFGIGTCIKKGYGAKRNVYAIIIRGKENLLKFSKNIGFDIDYKKRKLNEIII